MRRRSSIAIGCVVVALGLGGCSSDGGSAASGGSAAGGPRSIHVVSQNLLHGTACPESSNRCRLPDRVDLFAQQLARADCPELVGLQETNQTTVKELRRAIPKVCADHYEIVSDDDPSQDREVVLTTDRVIAKERVHLAGPLRTALWVRVGTDVGPVDFVTTHLASSSDDRPCDRTTCPPPCEVSDTLNTCQGRQAADVLDAKQSGRSVGILAGDLNAARGEPTIAALEARGYIDTHLAAGNAECDPATGSQCTSGRIDDALTDMTNASSRQTERIDYIWLVPVDRCHVAKPAGVFAAEGGPNGAAGLVFPSDHNGVEATVRCSVSDADRAATQAAVRAASSTTTTSAPADVSADTKAAVTAAFDTVFGAGEHDPDVRLRSLEEGDLLRESFLDRIQSVGALANQTSVRIESMGTGAGGPNQVDVVYSILLNGAVVLDALPGKAVKVGDTWLVSRATYCQVATLGVDTIPEPCKT